MKKPASKKKDSSRKPWLIAKEARRKKMATLSVEEKFEILIKLQNLAWQIGRSQGRKPPRPWIIHPV